MAIIELIKKRYAVKDFTGEKISKKFLNQLKEVIRLAPSSFNWQPWKVKIVEDKKTLQELQKRSWNQPQIGNASHLFVFCRTNSLKENNKKLIENLKKNLKKEKVKAFQKISNNYLSKMSKENQERMSERELFLAVENLLLTAVDLGYGACPVGGFEADKYSKILKIPKNLKPVVVVPIGIPNDKPRKKYRFPKKEIFF
jgi:nitroreductase